MPWLKILSELRLALNLVDFWTVIFLYVIPRYSNSRLITLPDDQQNTAPLIGKEKETPSSGWHKCFQTSIIFSAYPLTPRNIFQDPVESNTYSTTQSLYLTVIVIPNYCNQ